MNANILKPKFSTQRLIEAVECLNDLHPDQQITGIQFDGVYGNCFNYQIDGSNWMSQDLRVLLNLKHRSKSGEPIIEHVWFSKKNYPTIEVTATFSDCTKRTMFVYHTEQVELTEAELVGLTNDQAVDLYNIKCPVETHIDKVIAKF